MGFRSLILPTQKELRNLYIRGRLSTYRIATQYSCDPKTIYRYLKLYKIPTRPRKHIRITKRNLELLYIKRKLSLAAIGKLYDCCAVAILNKMKGYYIARRSTSEANIKHLRKNFNGNLGEKAYIIGFRIGDFGVRKKGQFIMVGCGTTKKDQLNLIKALLSQYGPGWLSKKDNTGKWHIDYSLNRSFQFLLRKHRSIPRWIFTNKKLFLSFLGGYVDAEGSIGIYAKRARLRIGSYDYGILRDIHRKLSEFGVNNRFSLEQKAGVNKKGLMRNGNFGE